MLIIKNNSKRNPSKMQGVDLICQWKNNLNNLNNPYFWKRYKSWYKNNKKANRYPQMSLLSANFFKVKYSTPLDILSFGENKVQGILHSVDLKMINWFLGNKEHLGNIRFIWLQCVAEIHLRIGLTKIILNLMPMNQDEKLLTNVF